MSLKQEPSVAPLSAFLGVSFRARVALCPITLKAWWAANVRISEVGLILGKVYKKTQSNPNEIALSKKNNPKKPNKNPHNKTNKQKSAGEI